MKSLLLEPIFNNDLKEIPIIIAGPCSVETKDQVMKIAKALHEQGIKYFRGGVWKPRTRPGGFEGRGSIGLSWMIDAAEKYDMIPLVEVCNRRQFLDAYDHGFRNFWIGARTSGDPYAVQDIADAIDERIGKPEHLTFLIKNPIAPDLDLWYGAFERLYLVGVRRMAAVHRGFRTLQPSFNSWKNNPCYPQILGFKTMHPEIPIILDPSHMTGINSEISKCIELSYREADGYIGYMIEVHNDPDNAYTDKLQQLTPTGLKMVLDGANQFVSELEGLRMDINNIDKDIVEKIAARIRDVVKIGRIKKKLNMPVYDPVQFEKKHKQWELLAERYTLPVDFIGHIFAKIHDFSCEVQENV